MPLEKRTKGSESGKLFRGEKTTVGQNRIQIDGRVALGKDEPVPVFPLGIIGFDGKTVEVKSGNKLRGGR
jgi:hypothetical protein